MKTTNLESMEVNTDLKFFTNEPDSTLLKRFQKTLKNNTQFFDVLVGYFRTSGFFHLYESLEEVEKIRILVGINANRETLDLIEQAKSSQISFSFSNKELHDQFSGQVTDEMDNSEDNISVEIGVQKFIEFIKSGKLEIRAYPSGDIHAKVYIIRKDQNKSDEYGKVITGSSNFSISGLRENLEFNVELKDSPDVKFALAKFESLWKDAVDLSEKYIETINTGTWLNDTITPYELYLKFLYEYLKEKINIDQDDIYKKYLPGNFLDLEYQNEAVKDAKDKLDQYGGVFLADVVGLGKTYISAMLAQQLEGRTLVICPPVLKEYWQETFSDFRVPADVQSLGKLDKLIKKGVEKYRNVFIDEAHRFRNESNQTYEKLKQVCWGRRVILVSATPLNNSPSDILSQMKLFQKGHNSTIPNIRDLDRFFGRLKRRLQETDRRDLKRYLGIVKENSIEIRENILKYVMVRRTRSEVLKYFEKDLKKQKVSFPKVSEPQKIGYKFDEELDQIFNETIKLIKAFKYSRYTPILYLKNPDPQEIIGQRNMGRFMKILLVKRLDSSFPAFKNTLNRFINSYSYFINMLDKGTVYLSKKYSNKVFDLLENDDEQEILKLVEEERVQEYKADEFSAEFRQDLESDLETLKKIESLWVNVKDDPKIDEFKKILDTDKILKQKDSKLIVFTESKETADYLASQLEKQYGDQVLAFSSKSSAMIRDRITENYDPSYKHKKDNLRILITTDILAEGVNLHRANAVINYDIPWNPTRVLQRFGRINRIGQPRPVHIYNFFPTDQSEQEIGLEACAKSKIQAFHSTLGEDAQYLTEGEEISSHEIFERVNSKRFLENGGEEEIDSELKYLEIMRNIRDSKPDLFERIKRLPKKARSAKQEAGCQQSLVTFFRKDKLKKMFLADTNEVRELDFFQAADILKSTPQIKRERLDQDFYRYLEKNKDAFRQATTEIIREFKQTGGRANETTLINTIKAIQKFQGLTDDDEDFLNNVLVLLNEGTMGKHIIKSLLKEIKLSSKNPLKILYLLKSGIPDSYFTSSGLASAYQSSSPREIILSEYLIKGD
ncbi:MAG: helicase [Candidatus Aquicultor secundus]|uniref:Helicase n=2 Tax=Candidatus Aquicultor secundus TaxID=1973895 RepID=A0A2M7T9S9_9ACTN|nr:helicase-related protein [Candidatus Aquicultor secundus]NCO66810.1 helicase [Solirubrobacter sp.]PIU26189.1 MAG: helicase [Candidatus Aquicultor secundus]PIW21392.1 MAG: helicase [Candidatus Aquicultor secundus]PIX51606.1 MAG: helicase [Candidatus Aquicultor secundus]PIY39041.1 MAG: helicase [Candidatus Aquicultor secundus]